MTQVHKRWPGDCGARGPDRFSGRRLRAAFLTTVVAVGLVLVATPAATEISSQCIQPDRIAAGLAPFSGNFCTANDLTFVLIGLGILEDGCVSDPDNANVLNLRAIVENTGAATRYDAGLWISNQGDVSRCILSGEFCDTDADCSGGQNVCKSSARWGGCLREILREPGYVLSSSLPELGTCSGVGGGACRNDSDCPMGETCDGGICDDTVGGVNISCGGAPPPTSQQGPYINEDGDGCGDIRKFGTGGPPDCGQTVDLREDPTNSDCALPDGPLPFTASPASEYQDQTVFDFDGTIKLPCVDADQNGFLEIPTCSSWGQNNDDISCALKTCSVSGQQCVVDADCPVSETCDAPSCSICSGDNSPCTADINCPTGQLCRGTCSNTGSYCQDDDECGPGTCDTRTCQGSGDGCVTDDNCPGAQVCTASSDPTCRTQQAVPGTSAKCSCEDALNSNVPVAALIADCTCDPPTTVRPGFPVTCTLSYDNPSPPGCTPDLNDPERFRCGAAGYLRFDLDDTPADSGEFAGICSGMQGFCSNTTSTSCSTPNDCPMGETCQVPTCNTDSDCPMGETCSLDTTLPDYGGTPEQLQWTPTSMPSLGPGTLGVIGAGDSDMLTFTYTPSMSAPDGPISLDLTTLFANKTCSGSGALCEDDDQCPMGETCDLDFGVDPVTQPLTASCMLDVDATHATVASVAAFHDGGRVVVEWETASEVGTVGFELNRLDPAGRLLRVTAEMLPATGHAPGATYSYVDELAPLSEQLVYQVVEIDRRGQRHPHGPFVVELAAEPRIAASPPVAGTRRGGRFRAAAKEPSPRHAARAESARADKRRGARARARAVGSWERVRIEIRDSGLYHLSAAEIAAAWGEPESQIASDIARGRLRLSSGGSEVAWQATANGSGLLFYGQAIDSSFTLDNVYWLERERGLRIAVRSGKGPAAVAGPLSFGDRVHFEEDLLGRPLVASDPGDDYWFWDGLIGSGLLSFSLDLEGVAATPGSARLTVGLWGFSNGTAAASHRAAVEVNGQTVGTIDWQGTGSHNAALAFDQALLQEGANSVKVMGLGGSFFVDSFDVDYDRLFQTSAGSLLVRGDGHPVVTVSGFGDRRIAVYDLTDPAAPEKVEAITIDGNGGSFSVSFEPAAAATPYYVVAETAWLPAARVAGDSSANLRDESNGADYLVIAPAPLMAPAEALADYRRSRGLEAMAVDLADIMEEFNDGVSHPEAIRAFLGYAYTSWRTRPRYVTLAGKGSYDYRDLLGLGGNLMPPLMAPTSEGLVPSDSAFGDLVGNDRMPELAIGRLPALTAQELWDMLAKIQNYELSAGGDWTDQALILADNADRGGNFPLDSNALAAALPGSFNVEKIYLDDPFSTAEARQAILSGINLGALFVNYTGHGGFDRLASEGMLTSADVAGLNNQERLPVVTALTCNISLFAFPGFTSLGEELVVHGGGGAIAVWAPAGLSFNSQAVRMGDRLIGSLFDLEQQRPLGDSLREALERYLAAGGHREMLSVYGLLGDSALMVQGSSVID